MSLMSLPSALRSSSRRSMRSTRLRRRSAAIPPVFAAFLSTTCNAMCPAPMSIRAAGDSPRARGGQWVWSVGGGMRRALAALCEHLAQTADGGERFRLLQAWPLHAHDEVIGAEAFAPAGDFLLHRDRVAD